MALISTVGGADSNSYVSEAEADTYFENHAYASAWETHGDTEQVLIYATTLLEGTVSWFGDKETTTQALSWPRILDDSSYDGIIPTKIKYATFELALHLVNNTELFDDESLDKINVGPIKLEFNSDNIIQTLPRLVVSMLSEFGSVVSGDASGISNVALVRV